MWRDIWQDARYAVRGIRKNPGFTAAAVLSLALGIGANTSIFSLIDTLMLRPLPVAEPGRLVELLHRFPGEPHFNGFSWRAYQYYLAHSHSFSGLIGTMPASGGLRSTFELRGEGLSAEKLDGVYVTGNFFSVLGLKPTIGRLIVAQDDRSDAPARVAVVSWAFWKNRLNSDPAAAGKTILVNDAAVTIIGVAPRAFQGWLLESRQDIWLPLALQPVLRTGRNYLESRGGDLWLVGRLKPGVPLEQARSEMAVLYNQTVADDPTSNRFLRSMRFEMEPAGAGLSLIRDQYANPLLVLMAVVGVLLLIACINTASLLLARATARQREMALRVSLGAGRARLLRQLWTESLVLAGAGSVAGFGLANLAATALVRIMASGRMPVTLQVSPDPRILGFTAGATVLTALLFGLAPAWRAWSTDPASSLRQHAPGGETRGGRLVAKSLVIAQVAFSVVLLSAAGVLVAHVERIYANLGFPRDHVLLVTLDPVGSGYRREQLAQPYRELLERMQTIPGVRSAALSGVTPVQGPGANRDANAEGYEPKPGTLRYVMENWVGPKYFETIGVPLLAGRDFQFEDEGPARVAIINQTMARFFFGAANPIGKHVWFDGDLPPYEIVGMVGDSKYMEAQEATPRTIYFNAFQEGRLFSQFSLRTATPPESVTGTVRAAVRSVLPTVRVDHVTTLSDQVDGSLVPERLIVTLATLFGGLGSVLAAIGLYGLLGYTVSRRTNEIGVRMALGAGRAAVMGAVLSEALWMVAAGVMVGTPLAWWGRQFLASRLPGVSAGLWPIVTGALLIASVAAAAAYPPARRAARINPIDALRQE